MHKQKENTMPHSPRLNKMRMNFQTAEARLKKSVTFNLR
jgi:hypothetical protein